MLNQDARILHHYQSEFAGNLRYAREIRQMSKYMDRHDCSHPPTGIAIYASPAPDIKRIGEIVIERREADQQARPGKFRPLLGPERHQAAATM